MKSKVHTVQCNISDEAAGGIWIYLSSERVNEREDDPRKLSWIRNFVQ